MSEARNAKLDAIDEILRNNPDVRPEFRTKLENLRAKLEATELRTEERIKSELARQIEAKQKHAERMERVRNQMEENNVFAREWKDHTRLQTDLIRRIAAKL